MVQVVEVESGTEVAAPALISPEEIAKRWDVHIQRVYGLLGVEGGPLAHARKVGNRWYISREAVERFERGE